MKKLLLIFAVLVMAIIAVNAQEIKVYANKLDKTVVADIIIEDNPGIAGFALRIDYDNKKLTPISIQTGTALQGFTITSNMHYTENISQLEYITAVWVNNSNVKTDGILYTIMFSVKDNAYGDTSITITQQKDGISDAYLNVVEFELEDAVVNLGKKQYKPKKIYKDVVESDWFFEDVSYVYDEKLMTGTSEQPELLFSPLLKTNRAMFVTALYRMENQPKANKSAFQDIQPGSYYENAVSWAAENGIVSGMTPTSFAPLENITREQTAKIIANYVKYKKIDTPVSQTNITGFKDYSDISSWAKEALQLCADMDIIRGRTDNTIDPQGNTTRAEMAAILRRLVEYMDK